MKKTTYSDPLDLPEIKDLVDVTDIFPSPEQIILKDTTSKVTLSLTTRSLEFFKKTAKKHGVLYQRMIRNLLDEYAVKHSS